MLKQVFVSTAVYALAHSLGMQGALDEVARQCKEPSRESLPVVRTITRLANLCEVGLHVDGGATYIGMMRSRAFHEAYKSGLPGWITLDDDIECTHATAWAMLEALDDPLPRIVLCPYMMRLPDAINRIALTVPTIRIERSFPIERDAFKIEREGTGGERVREQVKLIELPKGHGGGMGMVGMNRRAMEEIVQAAPPEIQWFDSDGVEKLALFFERLEDCLWWGEDTSFFKWRVPATVTVEALLVGTVSHGGIPLDLSKL